MFFLPTFILLSFASQAQDKVATIVFVCEHGGARSTIASTYFNKIASEKNLPYRSIFRGLTPDAKISTETSCGLRADGFEVDLLFPSALSLNDVGGGALLVSLDCSVPAPYQTFRAWKDIPAISENYAAARNEILRLVYNLVDNLKGRK